MDLPPAVATDTRTRQAGARRALGYFLAAACLVWVFHDVRLESLLDYIGGINWWWIPVAVACDVVSYLCDGARWHILLRPVGALPVMRATQAIYVGLFTNEVVPMRAGELVRAYLASRWMSRPISDVVPSILLSRLIDGVWLAVGIGITALLVSLPVGLMRAADFFGIVVLGLVVLVVFLVLGKPTALPGIIGRLVAGLRDIGSSGVLPTAALFSLGIPSLQAVSFWLVMRAYHLPLPLVASVAVFLILHLGTAIPNAPANVGSYQFFTILGLQLFGVGKTQATGFAVIAFLILTLPLWGIGLVALSRTGMTLAGIRADLHRMNAPCKT